MHLHGHLKDVILDYGPVQEFWCFPFERYNMILVSNQQIIVQLNLNCCNSSFWIISVVHITSLMSLVKILPL